MCRHTFSSLFSLAYYLYIISRVQLAITHHPLLSNCIHRGGGLQSPEGDIALLSNRSDFFFLCLVAGYGGQQTPTGDKQPPGASGLAVPPPPNYGATSQPGPTTSPGEPPLPGGGGGGHTSSNAHGPPAGITLPTQGRCPSPGSHPPPPSTPIQGVPPRTSQGISMPTCIPKDRENAYNSSPDAPSQTEDKNEPPDLQREYCL